MKINMRRKEERRRRRKLNWIDLIENIELKVTFKPQIFSLAYRLSSLF